MEWRRLGLYARILAILTGVAFAAVFLTLSASIAGLVSRRVQQMVFCLALIVYGLLVLTAPEVYGSASGRAIRFLRLAAVFVVLAGVLGLSLVLFLPSR